MDEMDDEVGTRGSPAWRWGLILAIALTALSIFEQAVTVALMRQAGAQQAGQTMLSPLSIAVICLSPIVELALIFCAGILAAREDGTVGAAARAGLFGIVISTFIMTVIGLVVFASAMPTYWSYLFATPELSRVTAGGIILTTSCQLIISGLFGMGVASLGGLIGRALYPDEEADQPPYPVYAGWDPAYGPPPYPPPAYGAPPAYGGAPGYAAPPDYGPPPIPGNRPTQPPQPPFPDVPRQ